MRKIIGQLQKIFPGKNGESWKLRQASQIHQSRFEYQSRFVDFDIKEGNRVLDLGSGGDPFPFADILVERYIVPSKHRTAEFKTGGKQVVISDINHLPFKDGSFDYIYCSHVLEHVKEPIHASKEIMRVGERGYIETPHFMTDALFAWADGMHRWFVQSIGPRLVFFEYDKRRAEGIRSNVWRDIIFSNSYHPIQDIFRDNKDIFTNMFLWESEFKVDVYFCDGTAAHSESF